jgi:hypothetical protein
MTLGRLRIEYPCVPFLSLSLKLRLAWPMGGEERVDMSLGVGRLLALEVTSDFVMAVVVREFEEQN